MPEQPPTEPDKKPAESELSTSEASVGPEPTPSEEHSTVSAKEATAGAAASVDADKPAGESRLAPARFPFFSLTVVSVLAALMIARAELSRLSGDMIDNTGRSWAFSELTGPAAVTVSDGWAAIYAADVLRYRQDLVDSYWVLGAVAAILFAAAATWYMLTRGAGRRTGTFFWVPVLAGALGVAESIAVRFATHHPPRGAVAGNVLAGLTTVRWLVLLGTLVVLAWLLLTPPGRTWRETLKVWRRAVHKHRLSIAPVAVIGLVTLTPAAEILDQVPDVVRRWADGPGNLWEALWAALSLIVLCTALYMLGRARLKLAVRNYPHPPTLDELPPAKPGFWLWGPGLIILLGIIDRLLGGAVAWSRLGAVCALPAAIWLTSLGIRRWEDSRAAKGKSSLLPRKLLVKEVTWDTLRAIVVLGDVLAFALLEIAALGVVRAFTAVIAVQAHDVSSHTGRLNPYAAALLGVGIVGVLVIWPAANFLVARLPVPLDLYSNDKVATLAEPPPPTEPELEQAAASAGPRTPLVKSGLQVKLNVKQLPRKLLQPRVILLVCVGGLVLFGSAPGLVERAGVLTSFIVSVGLISGIVAAGALITQERMTDDIFRLLRVGSTPMITLFLLAVVFAGLVGSSEIHAVRSQPEAVPVGTADPRPNLENAFADWLADPAACRSTVTFEDKSYTVRPMIFVAAEGGGVRAAYWTVRSLGTLATEVPCAAHSTFLSSGVSGGAVGLSVVRFNAKPDEVMQKISSSGALSVGILGTLLRDFAYSAAGIPLPYLGDQQPFRWTDRAALMEGVWNDSPAADWKDKPFVVPRKSTDVQPGAGQVILNSDSLGNACRVWISQIQFSATSVSGANEVGQQGVDCDRAGAPGLRSVDLISDYGPYVAAATDQQQSKGPLLDGCIRGLTAATAGLLAARFPYVTPSGVIGPCKLRTGAARGQDQLLDGGYLENSGLGTIVDLSPQWLALVRAHNIAAVADRGDRVLVVPTIVYLDNDTGNDRSAAKRDLTSEFLVPPTGKLRALTGLETNLSYLQRAKIVVTPDVICGSSDVGACGTAVAHLGDRRVIEVYQASRPKLAVPLGWILSDASRDTMNKALADQTKRVCSPPAPDAHDLVVVDDAVCKRQFGTLGDLIQMLKTPDS